jgi:hypothetical protein
MKYIKKASLGISGLGPIPFLSPVKYNNRLTYRKARGKRGMNVLALSL